MKEIAAGHNASPAQIALAWLLTKPVVSSIIVGASKIHQLEDNLKAVNVDLSAAELKTLDDLTQPTAQYPHWFVQNLVDPQHKEIFGVK